MEHAEIIKVKKSSNLIKYEAALAIIIIIIILISFNGVWN